MKGRYTGEERTWHPKFGWLEPGEIYNIPDDWDFKRETLFEPVAKGKKTEQTKGDN